MLVDIPQIIGLVLLEKRTVTHGFYHPNSACLKFSRNMGLTFLDSPTKSGTSFQSTPFLKASLSNLSLELGNQIENT